MTIDELILALEAQKTAGIPGATPVGVSARDNNGRRDMALLDLNPRVAAMAKDEHAKGWTLCRLVSRGGVPVMVLG